MSLFDDPTVGAVPEPTYSVGELSDAIGRAVRVAFRDEVWVRGEIHDLTRAASGHVYLTLVEPRDDGTKACKDLTEQNRKTFRGLAVRLAN